jgi:hypothetical protein
MDHMGPTEAAELFLLQLVLGPNPLPCGVVAVLALRAFEKNESFFVLHGFNGMRLSRP